MADDLTVRSGGVGTGHASTETPKQSDPAQDAARAQLDKLKAIAKERHGKSLDDKTLEALVKRHQAKVAGETQLKESAKTFETERGREAVGLKNAAEAKTEKTTGTEKLRGADGLSDKDRQSVRSDPKAGPKLPPTDAKPVTKEQATQILGKVLEHVRVNGEKLDPQQYAQTLRQLPPSQPKDPGKAPPPPPQGQAPSQPQGPQGTPQAPQGRTAGATTSTSAALDPRTGQTQGPIATPRGPQTQGPTRPTTQTPTGQPGTTTTPTPTTSPGPRSQTPGTTPQPPGTPQTPGTPQKPTTPQTPIYPSTPTPGAGRPTPMGTPGAGTGSGVRPGGATFVRGGPTAGAASGSFNAGGGLISSTSFDGMSFNWDGFFANFMIESQADLAEWRKRMRELKRKMDEAKHAGIDFQVALLELNQTMGRFESVKALNANEFDLIKKGQEAVAAEIAGGDKPQAQAEDAQKMGDFCRTNGFAGRYRLSPDELRTLKPEARAQYESMVSSYRGGIIGEMSMLQADLDRLRGSVPKRGENESEEAFAARVATHNRNRVWLEMEVASHENRLSNEAARVANSPQAFERLHGLRGQRRERLTEVEGKLYAPREQMEARLRERGTSPEVRKELEAALYAVPAERRAEIQRELGAKPPPAEPVRVMLERELYRDPGEARDAAYRRMQDPATDDATRAQIRSAIYASDALRRPPAELAHDEHEIRCLRRDVVSMDRVLARATPVREDVHKDLSPYVNAGDPSGTNERTASAYKRQVTQDLLVDSGVPEARVDATGLAPTFESPDVERSDVLGRVDAGDRYRKVMTAHVPSAAAVTPPPAEVKAVLGTDRDAIAAKDAELRTFCGMHKIEGRTFLMPSELKDMKPAEQELYKTLVKERQELGGHASYVAALQSEAARLPSDDAKAMALSGEYGNAMLEGHQAFSKNVGAAMATPGNARAIYDERAALRERLTSLEAKRTATPPPSKEEQATLDTESLSVARQIALYDRAIASHEKPSSTEAAALGGLLVRDGEGDASEIREAATTEQLSVFGAGRRGSVGTNPNGRTPEEHDAYLRGAIDAGDDVNRGRAPHVSTMGPVGGIMTTAASVGDALGNATNQAFGEAVNRAVDGVRRSAKQSSAKANASMKQHATKMQGMVNQLAQLLALSRSR